MKKNSIAEIFAKARNDEFIDRNDLSFLIRQALKRNFPKVKFSVRNPHGSSICIEWTDGPSRAQIVEVIGPFETKGFDGSIDLAFCKKFWLYTDGSASHAYTNGTADSLGYVGESISSAERPDGVPVSNVAGVYISENRNYSVEFLKEVIESLKGKWDLENVTVEDSHWGGRIRTDSWDKERLVYQEAQVISK